MKKKIQRIIYTIKSKFIIFWFKLTGPPRLLTFDMKLNAEILRAFGANIGRNFVRIHSPIILHESENGYSNLTINDNCILNGNNYLDLSAPIILEEGSSLGGNVIIMTHNRYNYNRFLEDRLSHTCGKKSVLVKKGAGIKAGALITMGVTIGENAVVAGGAVANRDVASNSFVAGVPARLIKTIK